MASKGKVRKGEEKRRVLGKAFIPTPNQHLTGLGQVNGDLMRFIQRQNQEEVVTLDMDATLAETQKEEAFYSYKGYRSYQPINVWWCCMILAFNLNSLMKNLILGGEWNKNRNTKCGVKKN